MKQCPKGGGGVWVLVEIENGSIYPLDILGRVGGQKPTSRTGAHKTETEIRTKAQRMRSLVTSIFLYACQSWTLTAELQRRIQAMEMRCYRKILQISYKDRVTNEEVRAKIQQAIGPHEDLLTIVKSRKLQWYDHVSRSSGLAKTILQGTVKGGKRHGRQRKR